MNVFEDANNFKEEFEKAQHANEEHRKNKSAGGESSAPDATAGVGPMRFCLATTDLTFPVD
jgi:hypothetical protein